MHEKYDAQQMKNDIALIELEKRLNFTGAHKKLRPICISENKPYDKSKCYSTGWGTTQYGSKSDVLQEAKMPIINDAYCKSAYWHMFKKDIMLCAGYKEGGISSCYGDSGGPLQCIMEDKRYFLHGITSWGLGCAKPGFPAVYTRVKAFIGWIKKKTGFK